MRNGFTGATSAHTFVGLVNQIVLALIFAGLLALSFLDYDLYLLAWIAFVPLLLATENITVYRTYFLGLLGGVTLFALGTYWVVDFIVISKGYSTGASVLLASITWVYCAHMIVFMLLLFRWLKKHSTLHEFVLFPLVVVAFNSWYPMLFSLKLGETQVNFMPALQGIEYSGVHGLDALIALVNIVVFRTCQRLFRGSNNVSNGSWKPYFVSILIIVTWFVYGLGRFSFWEESVSQWSRLKVGLVQPNEVPELGKRPVYSGYGDSYPPEMEMTERLSRDGAEVVIWPEAQTKNYLNHSHVRAAYHRNIKALGISLIFQDTQRVRNSSTGDIVKQYNSAIMIDSSGEQSDVYRKIKRIPFGEYLPIASENSLIRPWAEEFIGEFLSEISAGESHLAFNQGKVSFVPLICYETTFPRFVANAIRDTSSLADGAQGRVLLGLSNDGWFGATHQPFIHIMGSIVRAVENRMPLVHVANNGPSIVVSPSGRVLFKTEFQHAGGYTTDVPFSPSINGSFYSRNPHLFDGLVLLLLIVSIVSAISNSVRSVR